MKDVRKSKFQVEDDPREAYLVLGADSHEGTTLSSVACK